MMLELAWTDAMTTRLRRWPPLEHLHSGPLAEPWQLPSTIISMPLTGATGGPSAGASTGHTRRHLVQPPRAGVNVVKTYATFFYVVILSSLEYHHVLQSSVV